MPQENRSETGREAELIRQVAEKEQRIKQLQQQVVRLERRDPPPPRPSLPGGNPENGGWMGW